MSPTLPTTPHSVVPNSNITQTSTAHSESTTVLGASQTMASLGDPSPVASSQPETKTVAYTSTGISPSVYTNQPQITPTNSLLCVSGTEDTVTQPVFSTPAATSSAFPASSAVSRSSAETQPVFSIPAVISSALPAPSTVPRSSVIPTSSAVLTFSAAPTVSTEASQPTTPRPSDQTTVGDRLAMLPLWVWVAVVVGVLFLLSCCIISCTICLCVKKRSKPSSNQGSQQTSRRASEAGLANGIERNPESATSTMEILYPAQEPSKKGRPVLRWDSLRKSWSRRSSRRKFSTFKPQLYPQENHEGKLSLPASSLPWQVSEQNPPGQHSTFGNHSSQTDIPNPDYGIHTNNSPVPSYESPDYKRPVSSPSYGNPDYQSPIPNPSYGNPDYQGPMPIHSTGNPDYHNRTSYGNLDYQAHLSTPNHEIPHSVPNSTYRNSDYQSPIPNLSYGTPDYPITNPNPSYGIHNSQKALPNPSYDGYRDDQPSGAHIVCADSTNGYYNPIFDMKGTRLGRQGSDTNLSNSQAFRQSKFVIENSLRFNKRPSDCT